jgi:beta-galactosidase/beta-glucuronidase
MLETPLRKRIDLSDGWEFVRGRVGRRWMQGRKKGGETVDLPHCWNRGDTFQFGRRSYSGRGAYRRVLDLPEAPEGPGCWRLRSEGFYGFGDIWLDGRSIARFDGQYLGFDKSLPEEILAGRHVVTVRLDNLPQRNVLPGRSDPDFLLYGGLAGRVWLEWVPVLHIDVDTVEVACERGPELAEILDLRCRINGLENAPNNLRMNWVITTADGEQSAAAGPAPVTDSSVSISTMIIDPVCWSPDDPQLYWAEGRLDSSGDTLDAVRVRFGVTRAEFRRDAGFFLDGKRVELHGCNRHESIPGLGNALSEELHRADARLLKDYGCNFVRLSHYPQHPAFLDACDEFGILVYAEIATWKSVSSSRGWRRAARRQMRDLILRDRHHPSVILWGMGNESRSRAAFLELRDIAIELDPTRAVTYAENHLYRARREKTVGIPEVWGLNYELDKLEEGRDACSLRNVVVAECCNNPNSIRGDDAAELTQVATLEYEWKILADRPCVAGHAVWSFTDYATEYRKRFRRLTGLFDAWRQPKMAAELFRARYAKEPFVSLFVAANDDEGQLHLFSNCDWTRIEVDGKLTAKLGKQCHHVVSLESPFAVVKAEGIHGDVTVHEELRSWGEAKTVVISFDDEPRPGETVSVGLTIRDTNGIPVRDWNGHITLAIEGDARLFAYTDKGEVLMSRGEGRAYVQAGSSREPFVIRASTNDLDLTSTMVTPNARDATES